MMEMPAVPACHAGLHRATAGGLHTRASLHITAEGTQGGIFMAAGAQGTGYGVGPLCVSGLRRAGLRCASAFGQVASAGGHASPPCKKGGKHGQPSRSSPVLDWHLPTPFP
jgi:hypothetical protein